MDESSCPFCTKLALLEKLSAAELVWQFEHSVVLLGSWQFYHGYCLVVARRHARELFELSEHERRSYIEEMCAVARAIWDGFKPHKLNYELLGNQVPHLHWHIFPRYPSDPNVLKPVWLALERAEGNETEARRLRIGPFDPETTALKLRERLKALTGSVTR